MNGKRERFSQFRVLAGYGKRLPHTQLAGETACPTTEDQPFARPGGAGVQPAGAFFRGVYLVVLVLLIALSQLPARAQTPDPQPPGPAPDPARPALNPSPAEQNWSFLANSSDRTDFFDPAKYIPFGENPNLYLSLGFEYRMEYEYFDNWMFGAGPQDHHGYVLNRAMPHFDFHAGSDFRLFSEFEFDFEDGRNGGPRPQVDEDRGDVHQAFIEIGPHVSRPHGIGLRAGRQEVVLGSGRLFDNNEGPNVKLSFDGVRAIAEGAPREVGSVRHETGRE
jgi:hypothetical protein